MSNQILVEKEDVKGVPVQKHPRIELSNDEQYEIQNSIINILAINNLSIMQASKVLNFVLKGLNTIRPWNKY